MNRNKKLYPDAIVIACEDKRLHQRPDGRNYIADFCKSTGCECFLITRAGAILDLVRPHDTGSNFDLCLLRDVKVPDKIHDADKIFIIGHENCGGYRYLKFPSREMERQRIEKDLTIARNILQSRFPGKEIKIFFAELVPGTADQFDIQEVI